MAVVFMKDSAQTSQVAAKLDGQQVGDGELIEQSTVTCQAFGSERDVKAALTSATQVGLDPTGGAAESTQHRVHRRRHRHRDQDRSLQKLQAGMAFIQEGRALAEDELLEEAYQKYVEGLELIMPLDKSDPSVASF